jgi:betaine-aldehyde dehydrogenase
MKSDEVFKRLEMYNFIGGQFVRSGAKEEISIIEPATEARIGSVADTTDGEINEAVARANDAQREWRKRDAMHRAEALHKLARRLRERGPVIAEIMTREMGKPYKEAMDEMEWGASALDYYAELGRNDQGRILGPNVEGQFHFTVKEPLGAVAVILPFNYPITLMCWEAAAALAAGNTVIVKPHEYCSTTTLAFMECADHMPTGTLQCVTGTGRVGAGLVAHSGIRGIAYTGNIPVGQQIAQECAKTFKRCLIETSGHDPFIIMPSAPMDVTVEAALFSAFMNCGQICVSTERFYVHESIHDEFVERLVEKARQLRLGNGLEKVDMGPMAAERERKRFEAIIENLVAQGAQVASGGKRPPGLDKGWFYEPTVLTGVDDAMEAMKVESFGPVAPICKASSFEEALNKANDSDFGLGANLYSTDLREVFEAVSELEAGMVWVNAPLLDNDAGPFGGTKLSGDGRQLGQEGLDQFRKNKLVMIDPRTSRQDFWWFPYKDEESFQADG